MLNATYSHGFQVQLGLDTRRFIANGHCEANGVFEDLDTSDVGFSNASSNLC